MTSRVALVMAPLLPRIRTGTGNMGLENGGGSRGGGFQGTKIKKWGGGKNMAIYHNGPICPIANIFSKID